MSKKTRNRFKGIPHAAFDAAFSSHFEGDIDPAYSDAVSRGDMEFIKGFHAALEILVESRIGKGRQAAITAKINKELFQAISAWQYYESGEEPTGFNPSSPAKAARYAIKVSPEIRQAAKMTEADDPEKPEEYHVDAIEKRIRRMGNTPQYGVKIDWSEIERDG